MKLIVTQLSQITGTESKTEFIAGIPGWWKFSTHSLPHCQYLQVWELVHPLNLHVNWSSQGVEQFSLDSGISSWKVGGFDERYYRDGAPLFTANWHIWSFLKSADILINPLPKQVSLKLLSGAQRHVRYHLISFSSLDNSVYWTSPFTIYL